VCLRSTNSKQKNTKISYCAVVLKLFALKMAKAIFIATKEGQQLLDNSGLQDEEIDGLYKVMNDKSLQKVKKVWLANIIKRLLQKAHVSSCYCEKSHYFIRKEIEGKSEDAVTQKDDDKKTQGEGDKEKKPLPCKQAKKGQELKKVPKKTEEPQCATENHAVGQAGKQCPTLAVCKYYMNGQCQHGFSGRGCKFEHPKICRRFEKFGRRGCGLGSSCPKLHRKVCFQLMRHGHCSKDQCSFLHPKQMVNKGKDLRDEASNALSTMVRVMRSMTFQQQTIMKLIARP